MAKKKTKTPAPAPVDTAPGEQAYALAVPHRALLDPRLPSGTIDTLGADLLTLGVTPPATTPAPATPAPVVQAPTLAEALTTAANLVTAIHAAVRGAKPSAT